MEARRKFTNSPTVANGVVYAVSSCNVDALNADTGTLLWTYETACHFGIDDAPTVANGVVYVGTDDGYLYALNAVTGGFLWRFAGTQYQSLRLASRERWRQSTLWGMTASFTR